MIFRKPRPVPHSRTSQPKSGMKSPEEDFAYALRLLGARDYSLEGLRRKLLGKGVAAPEVEGILRRLESLGFLDDERYARRLASYCTKEKLWGPRRVAQKLLGKGNSVRNGPARCRCGGAGGVLPGAAAKGPRLEAERTKAGGNLAAGKETPGKSPFPPGVSVG